MILDSTDLARVFNILEETVGLVRDIDAKLRLIDERVRRIEDELVPVPRPVVP